MHGREMMDRARIIDLEYIKQVLNKFVSTHCDTKFV